MFEVPDAIKANLPKTSQILAEGMLAKSQIGGQLFVSMCGSVAADDAFGLASEGVSMQVGTLMLWLSAGKPLTAAAVGMLAEAGKCHLDDPVIQYIPEFITHGKDAITIRHLLTHTSCLRGQDRLPESMGWDERIDAICNCRMDEGGVPGVTAGYHISSSWFILGEIIRRITGQPADAFLREQLFLPLGMEDTLLCMDGARYDAYGSRIGRMHITSTATPTPHPYHDSKETCSRPRPGGSARGPIRELGRFYLDLLRRRKHSALFEKMTSRQRTGLMDLTFQFPMDWGLGFILNSNRHGTEEVPYSFGRHASDDAFGHGGAQSSCAFADPAHGLVVAWVLNGMCGERAHNRRSRELNSAIYQDLGLA